MDITLIIPHDEGIPDVGCDISAGIEVYLGRLTLAQLTAIAVKGGEVYPNHAIVEFYKRDGTLDGIHVTFTNNAADEPVRVLAHYDDGHVRITGYEFDGDSGQWIGKLTYTTQYSTMKEAPIAG